MHKFFMPDKGYVANLLFPELAQRSGNKMSDIYKMFYYNRAKLTARVGLDFLKACVVTLCLSVWPV